MFKFDFCLVFFPAPFGRGETVRVFLPQFLKKGVINEAAHPGFKFKEKKKGSLNPNLHVPACRDFPPSSDGSKKCAGIWILISPLRERYERSSFQRTEENIFNPGLHYGTSYTPDAALLSVRYHQPSFWHICGSDLRTMEFSSRLVILRETGAGGRTGLRLPLSSFHAIRRPFAPLQLWRINEPESIHPRRLFFIFLRLFLANSSYARLPFWETPQSIVAPRV